MIYLAGAYQSVPIVAIRNNSWNIFKFLPLLGLEKVGMGSPEVRRWMLQEDFLGVYFFDGSGDNLGFFSEFYLLVITFA